MVWRRALTGFKPIQVHPHPVEVHLSRTTVLINCFNKIVLIKQPVRAREAKRPQRETKRSTITHWRWQPQQVMSGGAMAGTAMEEGAQWRRALTEETHRGDAHRTRADKKNGRRTTRHRDEDAVGMCGV